MAFFDSEWACIEGLRQFLAVIHIDLDNFKPINDTAGHSAGDKTLKLIAKKLKDNTHSTDICARVGGDEFVVVATQIENEEHVHLIAKKLLSVLTEEIQMEGKTYVLGASIGICSGQVNLATI